MERIVKLTFLPEHADQFVELFESIKVRIRATEGCLSLKLIRDRSDPCIFMTYSVWKGPEYLQQYRRSELFKGLWTQMKPLFSHAPEAWSLDVLEEL